MSRRDATKPALSREDRRLWDEVRRSVKPLSGHSAPSEAGLAEELRPATDTVSRGEAARKREPLPAYRPAPHKPARPSLQGIDDKTIRKLKKGRLEIDARIDLHGMAEMQAHHALHRFLDNAGRAGLRIVLVITGKGARSGGVLRNAVPRWFREPPFLAMVAACRVAHISHGGEGALYVRLRRRTDMGSR